MTYYHSNEDDRILSADDVRREYYENPDMGADAGETFEEYLEKCMAWNNGDLTPLDTYANALRKRLREVEAYASRENVRELYADEIETLSAEIAECEKYKEV